MTTIDDTAASDARIQFFLPHLSRHFETMANLFSRLEKKDLSDAEWLIITNDKKSGSLLNHHYLSETWPEMEAYLKQKVKLFCFLEEKQEGLVGQSYTFWVFFSPAVAADFFKSQVEKPKHFSAKQIRPVPFPKLQDPLIDEFKELFQSGELNAWQKLDRAADLLKLVDTYLKDDEVKTVDDMVKRKVIKYLNPEIAALQEEIFGANAATSIVARRLRCILRIGWRYFRAKNELETKYFRKLLSESAEERNKGLKLAKKKLIDFELAMAE